MFNFEKIEPFLVPFRPGNITVAFVGNNEQLFCPHFKVFENLAPHGVIFDDTLVGLIAAGFKLGLEHSEKLGLLPCDVLRKVREDFPEANE